MRHAARVLPGIRVERSRVAARAGWTGEAADPVTRPHSRARLRLRRIARGVTRTRAPAGRPVPLREPRYRAARGVESRRAGARERTVRRLARASPPGQWRAALPIVHEFCEALDYLAAHPEQRRAFGAQGLQFVEREYRWQTVLPRVEGLLRRLPTARASAAASPPV
jgi:hypothetical protein